MIATNGFLFPLGLGGLAHLDLHPKEVQKSFPSFSLIHHFPNSLVFMVFQERLRASGGALVRVPPAVDAATAAGAEPLPRHHESHSAQEHEQRVRMEWWLLHRECICILIGL